MKTPLFLLPLFWTLVFANLRFPSNDSSKPEVEYPKTQLQDLDSVRSFLRLAYGSAFNISMVLHTNNTKDDATLEFSMSMTFPAAKGFEIEDELNEETGRKFLEAARGDKLAAKVRLSQADKESVWENTIDKLPVTNVHRMLTEFDTKRLGFNSRDHNYVSQHTFFTQSEDGKSETVKVLSVDFDIQVLESLDFTDEEIAESKKLLTGAFIVYTPRDFPKALVALFKLSFPGHRWQFASDVGKNNYIKAKKMISLKLDKSQYMLYSI